MKNRYTLAEILRLHTVAELKQMAKGYGLKGYSKLKKEEVIELIAPAFLEEEEMHLKFLVATKEEIEDFERALSEQIVVEPDTYKYYYWQTLGYAFINNQYEVQIPQEIEDLYYKVKNTKQYQITRMRTSLIHEYALACTSLYAVMELLR